MTGLFPEILSSPESGSEGKEKSNCSDHMAAFHTGFNIINTLVFLPFVKYLARAAEFLVKHDDKTTDTHLMYISTNVVSIPSININQARLEIVRMAEIVNLMFDKMTDVLFNPDKKLGKEIEEIQTLENQVDLLEREISNFLVKVSRDTQSRDLRATRLLRSCIK